MDWVLNFGPQTSISMGNRWCSCSSSAGLLSRTEPSHLVMIRERERDFHQRKGLLGCSPGSRFSLHETGNVTFFLSGLFAGVICLFKSKMNSENLKSVIFQSTRFPAGGKKKTVPQSKMLWWGARLVPATGGSSMRTLSWWGERKPIRQPISG